MSIIPSVVNDDIDRLLIYKVTDYFFFFSGTGSYPPLQKGLHLKILQTLKSNPLKKPWISNASRAYEEQVG